MTQKKRTAAKLASLVAVAVGMTASAVCQSGDPIPEIANSHIEANVPEGKLFGEYLSRDLQSYFCQSATGSCRVEYELLRQGPTQTGISYPKYYLWARCFKSGNLAGEGALQVEAVDQQLFRVTHFLSPQDIVRSPSEVAPIFPAPLVNRILTKARGK